MNTGKERDTFQQVLIELLGRKIKSAIYST